MNIKFIYKVINMMLFYKFLKSNRTLENETDALVKKSTLHVYTV